jgi:peptidoglycan LD-endopeptidase LytH
MKRPRTVFGPILVIAIAYIAIAVSVLEQSPQSLDASAEPQRKGGHRGAPAASPPPRAPERVLGARLTIPVAGVTRRELSDTWGDARSQGRTHQGIDIMAPQGARVQAAADGRIVKFFNSERGGVTVYQFDSSERFVYYYAHLSARAAGLAEGDYVRQGATIGYVGMTGNAPVPHLHFEIGRLDAEKRWWRASAMNPYPLLITGSPPA